MSNPLTRTHAVLPGPDGAPVALAIDCPTTDHDQEMPVTYLPPCPVRGESLDPLTGRWQPFTHTCTSADQAIRLLHQLEGCKYERNIVVTLPVLAAARWLYRARVEDIAGELGTSTDDPRVAEVVERAGNAERIAENLERGSVFTRDGDCLRFTPVPSQTSRYPYDTVKVTVIGGDS